MPIRLGLHQLLTRARAFMPLEMLSVVVIELVAPLPVAEGLMSTHADELFMVSHSWCVLLTCIACVDSACPTQPAISITDLSRRTDDCGVLMLSCSALGVWLFKTEQGVRRVLCYRLDMANAASVFLLGGLPGEGDVEAIHGTACAVGVRISGDVLRYDIQWVHNAAMSRC